MMDVTRIRGLGTAGDPRAPLAAFLSFVFPGLGQAYNGERGLALLLAAPALLALVIGVAAVVFLGSALLPRLFDVRTLQALVVLDIALLGWRLVAIAQAYGWRERLSLRRWTGLTTVALLLATLAMHAVPAWYAAKAIDTLASVSREGGGGGAPGASGAPQATPLPEPSNQPEVERAERVTILLVGVDEGPGRSTFLTDTMLVVSLDPATGRTAMISVPRDLYRVPLPDGRVLDGKLNALLAIASQRPDEFPLGGVGTLKATIGELLGLEIHYYAQVNLLGFRDAIDAIGGVDVTVERAIADPTYLDPTTGQRGFFLQPGTYRMDGTLALAFARSRKGAGDNDFTRADRQQQLLTALQEQLTAGNLLTGLPALLDAVKASVATDIPANRIAVLAQVLSDADLDELERVVLQPPEHMTADAAGGAYVLYPDLDAIRDTVRELLAADPPGAPLRPADP